ncbi:MAG: DUF2723 domain-containing protein [Fibrobacteria bacterium]|nr:DUF2723 domain-containing protein [Fibrobacteria bacterium]
MNERKLKWYGAGIATLFALIVYSLTVAPTVSFWDCGEFISAGKGLMVPHPPGAPLHHVLARLAVMFFVWFPDLGMRVNWTSSILASLTAGIAYLTAFKSIRMFQTRQEKKDHLWAAAVGGIFAGLLTTFGDTFWFSAVEAEVYCGAMFVTLLGVYLMLEWTDLRNTVWGDRLLVVTVYISYLGTYFTLFTVMFLPLITIWMVVVDKRLRTMWPLYIAGPLVMSVLYMPGNTPFILIGTFLACLLFWKLPVLGQKEGFKLSAMISLSALMAWSLYLFIPIRSALDPIIDEGDPEIREPLVLQDRATWNNLHKTPSWKDALSLENWGEFQEYIERKQYGSENPLVRAMTRRAHPLNQLLVHENMGYGGYLFAQFLPFKPGREESFLGYKIPSMVAALQVRMQRAEDGRYVTVPGQSAKRLAQWALFILAHLPLWWLVSFGWKRDKTLAGLLAGLYIFSSFGILGYVNFADGTRPETSDVYWYKQAIANGQNVQYPAPVHMEVRERDYFFTPAYVLVSILYGMAMAIFLMRLRQQMPSGSNWTSQPKFVGAVLLCAMVPVVAGTSNWTEHDRSRIHVPYDYAYNLLMSCPQDAILFTNGDNDTFPLWALQETYGVRRDVRLVNLSLINTDWYIRQMRDIEPKVPLLLTDAEIKALSPERNPYPNGMQLPVGKRVIDFPGTKSLPYLKIQDKLIMHIIMANEQAPKRKPVVFAATVGDDNMLGFAPYCRMQGMVYVLTDSLVKQPVDVDRTVDLFENVYKYRGMDASAPKLRYLDDDSRRLLMNYASIAIQTSMAEGDEIRALKDSLELPGMDSTDGPRIRKAIDARLAVVTRLLRKSESILPDEWRTPYFASQMYTQIGRPEQADSILAAAQKRMPDEPMILRARVEAMQRSGRKEQGIKLMDSAAKARPNDAALQLDLAMVLAEAGRDAEALKAAEAANTLRPGDGRTQQVVSMLQNRVQMQQQATPPVLAPAPTAPVAPPAPAAPAAGSAQATTPAQ